jgi:3-oxoacyl-[acyl-carrier protein] reductase
MKISGRRSIMITGATGVVGRAICQKMARQGWDILVGWYRSDDSLCKLVDELSDWPVEVLPMLLDMNQPEVLVKSMELELPSPLGALVINASCRPQVAPMSKISLKDVSAQLAVSALGPFELIRQVWRCHFKKYGTGHIIALSSAGLDTPVATHMSGYLVGKAAMESVVGCAVAEYGQKGLSGTILRPRYIDTPLLNNFEPRFVDLMRERALLLSPEVVADAVAAAALLPPPKGTFIVQSI